MVTNLTEGKVNSVLWKFTLPMFISVVFQQFYNMADSAIAGQICRGRGAGGSRCILSGHYDLYGHSSRQ